MKAKVTPTEILEEEFRAIQDLLQEGEQLLLTPKSARLLRQDRLTCQQDELVALGTQPTAAMLRGRDATEKK